MYVCGLARISSRPLVRSSIVEDASRWRPRPDRPCRSASRSSTIQPMLWRVSSYWLARVAQADDELHDAGPDLLNARRTAPGRRPTGLGAMVPRPRAPALALPPRDRAGSRCHAPRGRRVSPAVEGTATMAAATGERNDERRHAASVHLAGTRGRTGRRDPGAPRGRRPRGGLRRPGAHPRRHRRAGVTLRLAGVAGTRPAHGVPGTAPGASPGVTTLPTEPPTSPATGWTKLDVPATPVVARLEATRAGETSVALSTSFRLRSLTDTPVRALADRLVVSPALKLRVAKVEGRNAVLRPAAPLRPAQIYRFELRRADGTAEAAWAVQAAWPLHVAAHPARRLQLRRAPRHRHRGHLRPARRPAHGRPQARHDLAGRRRPLGAARRHVRLRPEQAARPQHAVHGHRPPRAAGRRDRHGARRDAGLPLRDHGQGRLAGPRHRRPVAVRRGAGRTRRDRPAHRPRGERRTECKKVDVVVHRLPGLTAAVAAWRRVRGRSRLDGPQQHDARQDRRRCPRSLEGSVRVNQAEDGWRGWFRLPTRLRPGWYVVTVTHAGIARQTVLQVTDVAAYSTVTSTRSLVWVNDLATNRALSRGAGDDGRQAGWARRIADGLLVARTPAGAAGRRRGGCPAPSPSCDPAGARCSCPWRGATTAATASGRATTPGGTC